MYDSEEHERELSRAASFKKDYEDANDNAILDAHGKTYKKIIGQKLHDLVSGVYQIHNGDIKSPDEALSRLTHLAKTHVGLNIVEVDPGLPRVDFNDIDVSALTPPSIKDVPSEEVENSLSEIHKNLKKQHESISKKPLYYPHELSQRPKLRAPQRPDLDIPETYLQAYKQAAPLNSHIDDLHTYIDSLHNHIEDMKNERIDSMAKQKAYYYRITPLEQRANDNVHDIRARYYQKVSRYLDTAADLCGSNYFGADSIKPPSEVRRSLRRAADDHLKANIEDNPGNPPKVTFD
jgi:hypothetical protein